MALLADDRPGGSPPPERRFPRWLWLLAVLTGSAWPGAAGWWLYADDAYRAHLRELPRLGQRTEGTVTESRHRSMSVNGNRFTENIFSYSYSAIGQHIQGSDSRGLFFPPQRSYAVGEKIPILYHPARPDVHAIGELRPDDAATPWLLTALLVLGAVPAVPLLGFLPFLVYSARHAPPNLGVGKTQAVKPEGATARGRAADPERLSGKAAAVFVVLGLLGVVCSFHAARADKFEVMVGGTVVVLRAWQPGVLGAGLAAFGAAFLSTAIGMKAGVWQRAVRISVLLLLVVGVVMFLTAFIAALIEAG